ncbi:MAG: hypothetical protein ACQKBU_00070, partial [Verrucomicrobiales bacterium]
MEVKRTTLGGRKVGAAALVMLGIIGSAEADILAGYDFSLPAGDQTPKASVVASGVMVSDMVGVG